MENFNDLKNLYEDGYRCIYQDGDEGNRNVYLKNFENEKSTVVNIKDENQQLKSALEYIKQEIK